MNAVVLTESNFEAEVLRSGLPVLVDFYADWCGPCRMLSPVLDEIAKEFAGKLKIGKVNAEEQLKLITRYHIHALPTVIVFRNGEQTAVTVGYKTRQQILTLLGLL